MICEYKKIYTGMLFWVLGLMLSMTLYPGDLKYVPTNYKHGMEVSTVEGLDRKTPPLFK